MSTPSIPSGFRIAALYRFQRLAAPEAIRGPLFDFCAARGIRGTLLLAREGINGTVAGSAEAIGALVAHLETDLGIRGLEIKYSQSKAMPFHRLKVRLKREIVTMGVDDIDPLVDVGAYVEPRDWNRLIDDPDTIVIDTRNDYETAIGSFEGAVDPQTKSFRAFPDWVERNANLLKGRRVAMFCTGGIRCEKATAYLKARGFDSVYHLKGGILRYLEEVPAEQSRWTGECFVFDERVSVGHGLVEGQAELCRACRHPLTAADRASPDFEAGVSCPHCHDKRSEEDRARYAERQRQVALAETRGKPPHIGQQPVDADQAARGRRR
ncbi:rhodanese-related sulfurtransferase [Aquibium carbonis]|uniref:tRNA uridine(34) hydroxylase n=1 Tax=Aquibium carbonis TaxID=2495581 RepID=A0A3R9YAA8_9HYPH|nr:rhodanese-related sulfurtransferase [Aquibium carbonis]RST83123.1 rhodanese-related sulfurtransferase [Aquibium carbonis]